jgi:hypothetical protein
MEMGDGPFICFSHLTLMPLLLDNTAWAAALPALAGRNAGRGRQQEEK